MTRTLPCETFQPVLTEEVFTPVLTKGDFANRYRRGEFGNASPTWNSLADFMREYTPFCLYHFRNGRVAGGETYYRQTPEQIKELWSKVDRPQDWYVSQQVPIAVEVSLVLQGEVMLTEKGLYLYYSTVARPMREALKEKAESEYGIMAILRLRAALCPNSLEWLYELLKRYPDHVIEFSAYEKRWGTLYPRFNTVFWEVRSY